jgi:Tfp pilus assembly protein PilF
VTLGNFWGQAKDYDRAMTQYQQALELAPDYVPAILGLAYVATERRDYEEAKAQAQRAIELVPDAPDAYVAWGYLHLEQDEPDEALAQFRQALEKRADDWSAQAGIGDAHLSEGECDSLARQSQELMAAQPRFADGRVYMGFAKLCDMDTSKALENFRKALELEPYSVAAQMGLGFSYSVQGRWEDATSAYVQALRLSAMGADIHNYMGHSFMAQGEMDLAKAEYLVALQLDPDSVEAHIGLGNISLTEHKGSKAQRHAEQALSLEETNLEARQILGIALVTQGEAEEGAAVLEQVTEEEPENASARFYLGLAYRDLGRYTQAKKEVETYLALNPMDPNWQQIEYLIEALEQGYHITEEKAISDLAEFLEWYIEEETNIGVEQIEGKGRTLVISLTADQEPEQDELLLSMIMAVAGAAYMVPRVDPPVANGVLVRVEEDGQPMSTMRVGLSEMKEYFDGVISGEEFVAKLQFSRAVTAEGPPPLEEIEADLSETRELSATIAVPYHPLTPAGLQERLTSSMDAQTREAMQVSDALLTLLGVIEPDVDLEKLMADLYTEQLAGYYDLEEKAFYVLEGEEQTALDQIVIAHEYTHALQDQHFSLEALTDESLDSDQRSAFDALVEGDATLAMTLYATDHIPVFDRLQSISGAGGFESEVLDTSPAFIREMQLFPYKAGLTFVIALYDSGGWAAVDEAYESPPLSTEQVLHPERYRGGDKPEEVPLPDLAAELGDDWREAESDVLGELGLRLSLAQYVGPSAAMMAAEGWAGDRYALLQQSPNGPYVLVMRTYWDDQSEADEFWALYGVYMAHRAGYTEDVEELVGVVQSHRWLSEEGCVFARQEDRYVTIVLGSDKGTVGQILTVLEGS